MNARKLLNHKRSARVARSRAKISGTSACPRLAVFRSNTGISVQLIDDTTQRTLAAVSSRDIKKEKGTAKISKTESAIEVGRRISKKAVELGIKRAVLDRRSYRYHGRVKTLTEAVRSGGLSI